MQRHASEMKILTFTDLYCCFITFYCSVLFYFIPCHVLSIMMFKCTLMKEQINLLKSKSNVATLNMRIVSQLIFEVHIIYNLLLQICFMWNLFAKNKSKQVLMWNILNWPWQRHLISLFILLELATVSLIFWGRTLFIYVNFDISKRQTCVSWLYLIFFPQIQVLKNSQMLYIVS